MARNAVNFTKICKGICRHQGNFSDSFSLDPVLFSLGFPKISLCSRPFSSIPKSYSIELWRNGVVKTVYKLEDALILFHQMVRMKLLPSVVEFNQLLCIIVKMKHYNSAITLIKEMGLLQIPINVYLMNIAINCCCHLRRMDFGFAFFGYFVKRGIESNVSTYNTLLKGLVLEERFLEAEMLFKKLIRDRICEPDPVTYGTIMNGLCKLGHTTMAIRLLRVMEEKGCKPDTQVYNMVIDSLCKDKMINDALKLLSEMVCKSISPDVVTYSSLIHGLCNFGRWKDARWMLREMDNRKISPDVHTFSILVDTFCKEGMIEDAKSVLKIMIERGEQPDIVTYNALIDGYCLQGQMKEAMEAFNIMITRGIEPDIITFNSLINGYCKILNIDEAFHIFRDISRQKLEPMVATYTTLLQGFLLAGRCAAARELFLEMQAAGLADAESHHIFCIIGWIVQKPSHR